ncbi:MAG TPA: FadR/GntR family transcriptional regulator [Phycisphaerae bacterium]|nr:FadR/GntR family transcriptional regulator [Phycisphaerae bacterium]
MEMQTVQNFNITRPETLVGNIARSLIGFIAASGMGDGDKLPSERQLVEQMDASRLPLREALSMLKGLGIVQAHHGKGVFVKQVELKNIFKMLSPLLKVQRNISMDDIMVVRYYLEPAIAAQAAARRTDSDIRKMQEHLKAMQDNVAEIEKFIIPDIAFHVTLAQATGNMIFDLFVSVMHDLIVQVQKSFPDQEASRKKSVQFHADILRAIIERDEKTAAEKMRQHIEDIGKAICKTLKSSR